MLHYDKKHRVQSLVVKTFLSSLEHIHALQGHRTIAPRPTCRWNLGIDIWRIANIVIILLKYDTTT